MRKHSLLPRFAPFVEPGGFSRIVAPANLVAARLQPSYYPWGEAWLDLTFSRDGDIALVPFVQIDPPMVYIHESSPFIWPSWLPLEDYAAAALEAVLQPWLLARTLLGSLDEEILGFFTDDPQARDTFEAARAARFLCASPVDDVLVDAAPYIYAQRFAAGKRVGISAPDAAFGAAILARSAGTVHADLGDPARNELARRWYGIDLYGPLPRATFDLEIAGNDPAGAVASIALDGTLDGGTAVEAVRPVFPLLSYSFDVADAAPVRRFTVRAREPILRPNRLATMPIIGGSAGRIAIVVRDDGLIAPEADVDNARALTEALCAQGFDAKLTVASAARAEGVDLIHLFGYRHVRQFEYVLDEAARLGVPVVSTPLFDDFSNESLWGSSSIRTLLSGVRDQAAQKMIEQGLASRLLLINESDARGKAAYDQAALGKMFGQCRAAIFATSREEAQVRSQFGFTGSSRLVPAIPRAPVAPEPIGALCGFDDYMLVHAAVEPRANQWLTMQAAAALGTPCVLVGTVEDADYYQAVLEGAASGLVWLPEPSLTAGQLEALYAGARVFVDVSWSGHGAARLVRAAIHGTVPVVSTALALDELWPDLTGGIDPASVESAVAVLRQAWMRAPSAGHQIAERTAQLCDPLRSLRAVLGAYAEAAGVPTA